jgi:transposase-like protein
MPCLFPISIAQSVKKSDGKIIKFKCDGCNEIYLKNKVYWYHNVINKKRVVSFCTKKCEMKYRFIRLGSMNSKCKQCKESIVVRKRDQELRKNHFCSKSCAATYNNTHKKTGTRRSRLEKWIEEQLITLYPSIHFKFNKKDDIESELDIYIPQYKLAFELNGIFHYEPIYGKQLLEKMENNDQRKMQACLERGIELCIIDTSQQTYFKPHTSQKYLDIIIDIINKKT